MSIDPKIFFEPNTVDQSLTSAPTKDVHDAILQFFDELARRPYVDPETLEFDGLTIGRAKHAGLDSSVGEWLKSDPSQRRVEIVAWFLNGYWRHVNLATWHVGEMLLEAADRVPKGSQAHVGTLLALHIAYCGAPLSLENKIRVKELLLRHLEYLRQAGDAYDGVVEILAQLHGT